MQNNSNNFQDCLARARDIAAKLAATAPNANNNSPLKRSNSEEDDSSSKRLATNDFIPNTNSMPESVLRAKAVAQKLNSQLGVKPTHSSSSAPLSNQQLFEENYKIPNKFVGLIIGRNGEQIIRLQAESECKVQIAPLSTDAGSDPPDRIAILRGSKEAIARARQTMDDIISKGRMSEQGLTGHGSYTGSGTSIVTVEVMLPSAKCGLVIGKGGETIKRISEDFGVKLFVVQESSEIDGVEHKPLIIKGEASKVETAKKYVLDSLSKPGGFSNFNNRANQNATMSSSNSTSGMGGMSTTGSSSEAHYVVPHGKAGFIIGKGGETIKEINQKSGAFVQIDKLYTPSVPNSGERLFKLRGTPDQIVAAQQLMYDKILNSPGGPADVLTPIEFQQKFNLPLVGTNTTNTWNNNAGPYGTSTNSNDPFSQWANAYGQWPSLNPYDHSTTATATTDNNKNSKMNSSLSQDDASTTNQMDPAWLAYYQQMSYYSMLQAGMSTNASTSANTAKSADTTTNTDSNSTNMPENPGTGQADYSQQWIEYYRTIGQHEMADELERQFKSADSNITSATSASTLSSNFNNKSTANTTATTSTDPWVALAQQWSLAATTSNNTNGVNSSRT